LKLAGAARLGNYVTLKLAGAARLGNYVTLKLVEATLLRLTLPLDPLFLVLFLATLVSSFLLALLLALGVAFAPGAAFAAFAPEDIASAAVLRTAATCSNTLGSLEAFFAVFAIVFGISKKGLELISPRICRNGRIKNHAAQTEAGEQVY
jgi:hypothetical protein